MTDLSTSSVDTPQLRATLRRALGDPKFRAKLDKQASPAKRITLLASRGKAEFESDRHTTLTVAQEILAEERLIPEATYVPFQPLPRKIRRPGTAAELALHTRLREVLHQKVNLLRKGDEAEALAGGFLILALVLEGGVLSRRELQGILTTVAHQGLRVMGELRYVNAPSQQAGGYTLDNRRVHLSPLLRALLLRHTPAALQTLAADPDGALRQLGKAVGIAGLRFTSVRNAMAAHCEHMLLLPLWLLSWMQHDGIHSSSLVEDCWLRLNGYEAQAEATAAAPTRTGPGGDSDVNEPGEDEDEDTRTAPDSSTSFDPTLPDANDPVFATIGRVLREQGVSPAETRPVIAELSPAFDRIGETFPAAPVLHHWLISLHDQFQSASTIRLNFFAIAHRLLAYCGDTGLDQLTPEDLDLIREQLIEDGLSSSTISNVAGALNHLIRFLGQHGINTTLTPVATGIAVALANARILLPQDIREVIEYLRSARCRLAPNHRRAAQDLLVLCFNTGLRRQEALHLDWQQVQGAPADICVRNTVANRLKTLSSRRNIPYPALELHQGVIRHQLRGTDSGLILQRSGSADSPPMAAGSDEHRRFVESVVRELHRIFRTVTGDEQTTMHSLRHSCATILILLLLAKRFHLHDLIPSIPLLGEILTPEAEQLAKDLLCPASYQNDAELAAVRDVLGHASESMTLAHYVHALDLLRLAALRMEWVADAAAIGAAAGFSDYLCRQHPLEKLLLKLEGHSQITVTVLEKDESIRFREADDKAGHLLRQMDALSMPDDSEEQLGARLREEGYPELSPRALRSMLSVRRDIETLAIGVLSKKSKAESLRDLMPVSRWRDEALRLCDNIMSGEASLDPDEVLYYRQSLCESIHHLLANCTRIGSSVVRIPDIFTLRSLEFICTQVMGTSASSQRFFTWDKNPRSHERDYLSFQKVESVLADRSGLHPTVFVKLEIPRAASDASPDEVRTGHRNPLSTFIWVMATYYILHAAHDQRATIQASCQKLENRMEKNEDQALFKRGDKLLRGLPLVCIEVLKATPVRFRHIDDRLATAWQNYCAQVQGHKSDYWDRYVSRIRDIIAEEVGKLNDADRQGLARACKDAFFIGHLTGPFDAAFFTSETAFVDVIYELVYYEATVDEDDAVRAAVPMEPWMR